jgi:DNA-binding LacI/PurR family transcriptional regulator
VDLRFEDPRIAALEELGLPTLVVGGPGHHGSLPSVYVDDAHATRLLVDHLAELGHARIARVAGDDAFLHTLQRDHAFAERCEELGVEGVAQPAGFGARGAEIATAELLARPEPPTAILFDSDEMALAGTHVLEGAGLAVPADLAVASYEDSPLARGHRPPITAVGRSATEYGRVAATRLLEVIAARRARRTSFDEEPPETRALVPELLVRGSTAPEATGTTGRSDALREGGVTFVIVAGRAGVPRCGGRLDPATVVQVDPA